MSTYSNNAASSIRRHEPKLNALPNETLLQIFDFLISECLSDIDAGELLPSCQSLLNVSMVNTKFRSLVLSTHEKLLCVTLPLLQLNHVRSVALAARNTGALSFSQLDFLGAFWKNPNFRKDPQVLANMLSALTDRDALYLFVRCFPGVDDFNLSQMTSRALGLDNERIDDGAILSQSSYVAAVGCQDERFKDSKRSPHHTSNPRSTRIEVWNDFRGYGNAQGLLGHWESLHDDSHLGFRESWVWVCRQIMRDVHGDVIKFFYDPDSDTAWNSRGQYILEVEV